MRLLFVLLRIVYRYAMAKLNLRNDAPEQPRAEGMKDTEPLRRRTVEVVPTACSACDNAKAEIEALKAALREKDAELEESKERERYAREETAAVKKQAGQDSAHLSERYQQAYGQLKKDAADAQGRLSATEARASRSETHAAELERALALAQQERRNMSAMLETRTSELRDAQAYLTKVSDVTDRDVLGIVESINSRIFQTAATIADLYQPDCHSAGEAGQEGVKEATKRLERSHLLGRDLARALHGADHREDNILVQIALQAAMVSYARWLCATWDFQFDRDGVLKQVYQEIREHEPQSVSGRWRALARVHVKQLAPAAKKREAIAQDVLAEHVVDILLACGVPTTREDLLADVKRACGNALQEITDFALHFQCVTGDHIVSREFFAVYVKSGTAFEPERMTDQWADPKKSRHRTTVEPLSVLCSTQLGLVREETTSHADPAKETRWEHSATVLLKPQVVLTTMPEELWNEQVACPNACLLVTPITYDVRLKRSMWPEQRAVECCE